MDCRFPLADFVFTECLDLRVNRLSVVDEGLCGYANLSLYVDLSQRCTCCFGVSDFKDAPYTVVCPL